MRYIGTARRGDVVLLDGGPISVKERNEVLAELGVIYDFTGIDFVILDGCARISRRRVHAKTGPTPRWLRRMT